MKKKKNSNSLVWISKQNQSVCAFLLIRSFENSTAKKKERQQIYKSIFAYYSIFRFSFIYFLFYYLFFSFVYWKTEINQHVMLERRAYLWVGRGKWIRITLTQIQFAVTRTIHSLDHLPSSSYNADRRCVGVCALHILVLCGWIDVSSDV